MDIVVEMLKNGIDVNHIPPTEIPLNVIHKIWSYL